MSLFIVEVGVLITMHTCMKDVLRNILGTVYMSLAKRASLGSLLKQNLILAMRDHRNGIGKFIVRLVLLRGNHKVFSQGHETIFVTKLSPANRASPAHVNGSLVAINHYIKFIAWVARLKTSHLNPAQRKYRQKKKTEKENAS